MNYFLNEAVLLYSLNKAKFFFLSSFNYVVISNTNIFKKLLIVLTFSNNLAIFENYTPNRYYPFIYFFFKIKICLNERHLAE